MSRFAPALRVSVRTRQIRARQNGIPNIGNKEVLLLAANAILTPELKPVAGTSAGESGPPVALKQRSARLREVFEGQEDTLG
jgi:hypothetical protein